jgi:chromosome segregation ATPase
LREQNQQLSEALASDQQAISQELDRARKECAEMERQYQDAVNNYDKDKALWEGKFAFLEQQRDQSKRDLDEASQKFQSTVEQLQKVQSDSKSKTDLSHN